MQEVTTEKITDLRSATAAEILDLAGIRQERPASTGKKPGAKSLE
jgi:hypothetical protein